MSVHRPIEVEIDGDTVKSVQFVADAMEIPKEIAQLVAGMKVDVVIARLEGNHLWLQAYFLSGSACQSAERDQSAAVVLTAA